MRKFICTLIVFLMISASVDATVIQYTYDGDGGLTSKTVDGVRTEYVGEFFEKKGNKEVGHVFVDGRKVVSVVNGEVQYYIYDHNGSVTHVTDEDGNIIQEYDYSPFGKVIKKTEYVTRHNGARYASHDIDPEEGIILMKARAYDPELGRFISPDIFVQDETNPQTLNRYAYSGNNPINNYDPDGYFWKKIIGPAISIAGVFVGMPFLGAIVASGVSTAVNDGEFKDFAMGVGVGVVAGYAGGFGAGVVGRTLGMNKAGIMMSGLRGAMAGGIGGAGLAAINDQSIGKGALLGAGVGTAMGMATWGINNHRTERFLNEMEWGEDVSAEHKQTLTQSIKEFGQSPVGGRKISNFLRSGDKFQLSTNVMFTGKPGYYARAEGNKMTINLKSHTIESFRHQSMNAKFIEWDTVLAHEFGHLEHGGNWNDPINPAHIENPYRWWTGQYRTPTYGKSPYKVPFRQKLYQY